MWYLRAMGEDVRAVRAERIAANEVTFRSANETVRDAAERAQVSNRVTFICECGNAGCLDLVELSLDEYERVRADPQQFFVVPGHEITGRDLGRVVGSTNRYTLVEKIGVSGEIARRRNPRPEAAAG
jgi:hypothetical protein